MAVRIRIRLQRSSDKRSAATLETTAVANSGFEAERPEALLPIAVAERLGLWPPAGARADRFESPAGTLTLLTLEDVLRVAIVGTRRSVRADAVIAERESEVVLNDWLVDALNIQLVAPGRGLYRIGARGRIRKTENPERW